MARSKKTTDYDDDGSATSEYQRTEDIRPKSVEEAARPQNPDYVPRYEDGTEKPKMKWSNLEQEMYEANTMSPESIRKSTDHLGPTARVGLDPRGPLAGDIDQQPEGAGEAPGSTDPTVPTGKKGIEKMEEQNQQGEQEILEARKAG